MNNPKFSIIIPTRNGGKYLPYCVKTILSQTYNNFELIISNNCSDDTTENFLNAVTDKRVKIIKTPKLLTMANNYEFALNYVTGDWILILGDDDGVQPYFFELAEQLVAIAEKKQLSIINATRAYYFWQGCEEIYKNVHISYTATNYLTIKKFDFISLLQLATAQKLYFDFPQMYATSFFSRQIVERVKKLQNNSFYTCLTPDANGAAIAFSIGKKYLHSQIPLTWVGTSPKSYGFLGNAILGNIENKKQEISQKVNELQNLSYFDQDAHTWLKNCGNREIISTVLFFYEALLKSKSLQTKKFNILINSKFFKRLIFAGVLKEVSLCEHNEQRICWLKEICMLNNISFSIVFLINKLVIPLLNFLFIFMDKLYFYKSHIHHYTIQLFLKHDSKIKDITYANQEIEQLIGKENFSIKFN